MLLTGREEYLYALQIRYQQRTGSFFRPYPGLLSVIPGELWKIRLNGAAFGEFSVSRFKPTRTYRAKTHPEMVLPRPDLIFQNGIGGFTTDGKEYVITTSKDKPTPAPWVNVLANNGFGTVISENGMAYTWAENSHEYRLTPWYNDPVTDSSGETMYLRDEETGHFWSPTPLTSSESEIYLSRHGFGYSVFEHNEGGIITELWCMLLRMHQ